MSRVGPEGGLSGVHAGGMCSAQLCTQPSGFNSGPFQSGRWVFGPFVSFVQIVLTVYACSDF